MDIQTIKRFVEALTDVYEDIEEPLRDAGQKQGEVLIELFQIYEVVSGKLEGKHPLWVMPERKMKVIQEVYDRINEDKE